MDFASTTKRNSRECLFPLCFSLPFMYLYTPASDTYAHERKSTIHCNHRSIILMEMRFFFPLPHFPPFSLSLTLPWLFWLLRLSLHTLLQLTISFWVEGLQLINVENHNSSTAGPYLVFFPILSAFKYYCFNLGPPAAVLLPPSRLF